MKGRSGELSTLARTILATRPTRVALDRPGRQRQVDVGGGARAPLRTAFGGRVDWFRSASWGFYTLSEMLALRFGTGRGDGRVQRLQEFLARGPQRLIVLDNHENDAAVERLFRTFSDTQATFVITARRCLLAGVFIFPVVAPLVTSGASAFPRVAALTRLLRWNPLALDIADGIVESRAASAKALGEFLRDAGVTQVRTLEHEDDLPEIALLIDWAWPRLSVAARRALARARARGRRSRGRGVAGEACASREARSGDRRARALASGAAAGARTLCVARGGSSRRRAPHEA